MIRHSSSCSFWLASAGLSRITASFAALCNLRRMSAAAIALHAQASHFIRLFCASHSGHEKVAEEKQSQQHLCPLVDFAGATHHRQENCACLPMRTACCWSARLTFHRGCSQIAHNSGYMFLYIPPSPYMLLLETCSALLHKSLLSAHGTCGCYDIVRMCCS